MLKIRSTHVHAKMQFSILHFDQRETNVFQLYLQNYTFHIKSYSLFEIYPILRDHKIFLLSISSEYDNSSALNSLSI